MEPTEFLDQGEPFTVSETITLPVGVEVNGVRYRNVSLEEMSGIDEHSLADKKRGAGNAGVGMSFVIARCIQEIEGLVPRKKNPESLIDMALVRRITQVDRDFLAIAIQVLGGNDEVVLAGRCPRCGSPWEEVLMASELRVVSWPEDKPLQLDFELPAGITDKSDPSIRHRVGTLRFPLGIDQEAVANIDDTASQTDAMLAACVTKLGTLERIDQELAKRLKTRDRMELMETLGRKLPGIRQWKTVRCSCSREFDITLDTAAFFGGRKRGVKHGS